MSENYEECIERAATDCEETEIDSNYSYSDASNYAEGDVNSSTGGVPEASRMSFLPWVVGASVGTMFVMLYAWKKRRDDQQLRNEDLLADEDSFHGSVARRFERANTGPSTPPAVIGGETSGSDYALA
eukprot:CAMPEP_0197186634 /NCGR_PEP_ID=MMETSP1423-20130617/14292_1 /TAXON_ID=476441 /ORGANISM="Pseudo-nitzschia heimii, Strain UNC1101" /LENGTH=127 /DNA_ID=CAMNT_0042638003 /DNA_START=434 /DNA_END=817 /DNA_ORIENTATION=-